MACMPQRLSPETPQNFKNKTEQRQLSYDDRPSKKLRSSRFEPTKKSSLSLQQVPVIRCACGRGPCSVFTSRSQNNREFYTCYERGSERKCRFFRWVDEVLELKVPQCPCGAGACSLNIDDEGRWFLACRIKKGHGACDFFQWAELRTNSRMNMHYHDRIPCTYPFCLNSPHATFVDDEEALWDRVVQLVESSNREVLSTSPPVEDEINNRDSHSIVQATKSSICQGLGTLPSEEADVLNSMSEAKSLDDDRKSVPSMQIGVEGDILNPAADGVGQHIDLQVCGLSDTLAIPPQHREDQPVSPLCCYDATLSGVESSAIGPNVSENSEVIVHQPPTPSKDAQLSRGVSRCHPRCQSHNTRENDSISLSVFKNIGQGLLKTLEDKNLVDRNLMFKIAESFLAPFQNSSIKDSSFSTYVMKYIDYKSRLAAVESSMREGLSSQELEGIFKREAAECEAYGSHFQSHHGESSCGKKRKLFRNLDQELEQYETETLEQKTSLVKINPEISARHKSMQAAWDEMEEAFAEEIERKFLQDEARTALEKARAELSS